MATENEAIYLKQVPLFAGLADEDIRGLMALAKRRTFRSGEVIFHREDPGQVLYVIKEGKVKISLISPDGQEISLVVFGKGECFGEFAILDGLPRSTDAVALEKVECYTLQRSDFLNAILKNPKIAILVLEALSKRLRTTDNMVEDLIFLDVYGRVAKKLLELAEAHGVKTGDWRSLSRTHTVNATQAMDKKSGSFCRSHFCATTVHPHIFRARICSFRCLLPGIQ